MKALFQDFYDHLKKDLSLALLTLSSVIGYLILIFISRYYLNTELTIPAFLSYIIAINFILSFTVITKDRFAASMLMSFNLIIEIICLACLIKASY